MAQVLFVFDTEDYTNPGATDAIKRYAQILTSHGVRGCFNVVGQLAIALEDQGRRDVIDALAAHEIDYHSWRHTWHPTVVEYGDQEDWYAGLHRFFDEERRGTMAVKRIFKRDRLFAAVPPGNCISTQSFQVFSSLGIPFYIASVFEKTGGRAMRYGNMINLETAYCWDGFHDHPDIEHFIRYMGDLTKQHRVIIYAHPNKAEYKVFWDRLNCMNKNHVEYGDWIIPERFDDAEIERFFAGFDALVEYVTSTPGLEVVTYEDLLPQLCDKRRPLRAERLVKMLEQTEQNFAYAEDSGEYYSLAELYEAAIHFVSTPARIADGTFTPRGIIGPLAEPMQIDVPFACTAVELTAAANAFRVADTVPEKLTVAGKDIGPADFMRAARQFLRGAETIAIDPKPAQIDYSLYYNMEKFELKNTWMHSLEFEDNYTTERLRLQAWSACPAE